MVRKVTAGLKKLNNSLPLVVVPPSSFFFNVTNQVLFCLELLLCIRAEPVSRFVFGLTPFLNTNILDLSELQLHWQCLLL